MINITLPDGSNQEYEKGTKLYDICMNISQGLARQAIGARVNGKLAGLQEEVMEDSKVEFLKFEDDGAKEIFWHTTSHIMALAIQRLHPNVKFAIGPAIDNGFYYDMELDYDFSPEDFDQIEKEMKKIVDADYDLIREEISREDALKLFTDLNQDYKIELINDLPEEETITIYKMGEFVDLCRGPHLMSTKKVKAFKLLSVAGAYWRGSEDNAMLQRIYGISFDKQGKLDEYLNMLEEAKKRDHRKLGKELGIFALMDEAPGFPFFLPNGMIIQNELINYWKEIHVKAGYKEISTPQIMRRTLWETSGHWDHYKDNMYTTVIDEEDYAIKPMNCPGAMLVFGSQPRSYRELPLRLGELGIVHRHEKSGALHGLMRVRKFTQDDAHIFISPDQITDEIIKIIKLIDEVYSLFGFKYSVELSTRPEDSMGSDEEWDSAINGLETAMKTLGMDYDINEGDGAFYGPKIDFQVEDSIGRTWQCGTIQLDFQMPQKFDLNYIGDDGEEHRPIVIHRVVYGSIERFIAILIEHYAGNFPTWLAPVQATLIPVNNDIHGERVKELAEKMCSLNLRVDVDLRDEKMGRKIRDSQVSKIPYQLVFGDNELENNAVSVRKYGEKKTVDYKFDDFLKEIVEEVKTKKNNL